LVAPPAPFAPLAVEADGLACRRGGRLVFEGVGFRLAPGELLAVAGPNGAGKSSLLRMVAGLLAPGAGRLALIASEPEVEGAVHYLGHADGLKGALTLEENLRFWAAIYGGGSGAPDGVDAAAATGVEHAFDLPAAVLSAGQRRRAALARLLLSPRPLWLLDEPTSALDRDGEAMLGGLLRRHLDAGGLAIAATHSPLPVEPAKVLELGAGG
jgi:heme exporter protein A